MGDKAGRPRSKEQGRRQRWWRGQNDKGEPAASILPAPNPKVHDGKPKGKGETKMGVRPRTKYHVIEGGCDKGKEGKYSHSGKLEEEKGSATVEARGERHIGNRLHLQRGSTVDNKENPGKWATGDYAGGSKWQVKRAPSWRVRTLHLQPQRRLYSFCGKEGSIHTRC